MDALIPKIDLKTFDFDYWVEELNKIDKKVASGSLSWHDYSNSLNENQKWIAKWGQETQGQIRSTEGLIQANEAARQTIIAQNDAIKSQTLSAKAATVATKALAIAGNMLAMWAVTKVVSELYELSQASAQVAKKAKDLGQEFSTSKNSIDDYKKKIEDLYNTINDSSSSINEVTTARKDLMTIQDELIDKFGNEKSAIEDITTAINGQTDALDRLSEKQWQAAKNSFNDGNWQNRFLNWTDGYSNNIDRMLNEYEDYSIKIDIGYATGKWDSQEAKDILELLKSKGADISYSMGDAGVPLATLSGNASDVYEKLIEIQNIFSGDNPLSTENFRNHLTSLANTAKDVSNQYEEFYKQYVVYEKILPNDKYAESLNSITQAYKKYEDAMLSGNNAMLDDAINNFAHLLTNSIDEALTNGDTNVAEYFESMYPSLQAVVANWKFELDFKANTEGLADEVKNSLSKFTDSDSLIGFNEKATNDEGQKNAYNNLLAYADRYNMSLDQLIEKSEELGLIRSKSYAELANIFGEDKIDTLSAEDFHYALTIPDYTLLSWDELIEKINEVKAAENADTFNFESYKDQIDNIQSSVETLHSALDSLNAGTLKSSDILDLMQQFPALVPYIDMTADGFGNLAEGLHTLIEAQPTDLIDSLETLKATLNTDEERAQVDALVNSLQALGSYGDTGMEAYATSIGSTWSDTANVIEGVVNQFENLAKVQEAVANGLTMSTNCAAELATIYPEILNKAQFSADGQVTLNEGVVRSILEGNSSIIDGQIAKLEADKAELTAKKQYAEAQLNILKQVGEGEGQISEEVAQYRIQVASQLLKKLIEAGETESDAYATVAEVMSLNTDEFNQVVAGVAEDSSKNMGNAAWSMADSIHKNMIAAQNSIRGFKKQIWSAADAMKAMFSGEKAGDDQIYDDGGAVTTDPVITTTGNRTFDRADIDNAFNTDLNLDDFQSQLELDIQGYTDAISNIDSQIEILKNLQSTFTDTINSANGGIGDHNYADKIKELEKDKAKINDALKDKKGSKKTKDEYKEVFDFFERRTKVLNQAYELLGKNLENVIGSAAKNKLIDAQSGIAVEQMKNYSDALNMYQEKANQALSKLDSGLQEKIRNGAVDLTEFVGDGNKDVVEAIKDYQTWADKVADCKEQLAELKQTIRQLELDKFNNIIKEFTDQFDVYGDSNDLIEKQVALLKEAGQLIGEGFYSQQKEQSQKQLSILEAEKVRLVEQLNSALSSGRVNETALLHSNVVYLK